MVAVLSPAKRLQPGALPGLAVTRPQFLPKAGQLAKILRAYAPWQLESVLRVNPLLALEAFAAYQQFDPAQPGTPALLAYRGLAYQSLAPQELNLVDFAFAQGHLRLLSAFYGLLRPADGILPHRLEMHSRLQVQGGSLYRFWGDGLYRSLFGAGEPVVNLASAEYARLLTPYLQPGDSWITCEFFVPRRGKLCCLPTLAKMARGRMARYLIERRAQAPQELQGFDWEGFAFQPVLSTPSRYVFVQEQG